MPTDGSPSQGTPSQTPSGNEAPQDNTAVLDELNQNRTDGAHEDDDQSSDFDWTKGSEPAQDSDDEVSQPSQPAQQPAQQPNQQPQQPSQTPSQTPQTTPQQPQQPPAQQPQPQPGTTQPTQQPQQPQTQGQPQSQTAQPQGQQPPAETDQQREERLNRERAEYTRKLEEYYKLPDELAGRFATEPEAVLPVIAAKLHQRVYEDVQRMMHQSVPQMIAYQQNIARVDQETRQAFFERWPSLKGHDAQILQVARTYAQMNPQATPEQKREMVGSIVCTALGINPDPKPGQGGNGSRLRTPVQQNRPTAPRPAATAGSSAGATPPSENPYALMAEEFLQDDQG